MAPIISVSSSSESALWDDQEQALGIVRSGLRDERYIVLNVDQDVSLAAQGTQLAYSNLVGSLASAAAVPSLRQLPHKMLFDFTIGQAEAPALVEPWLPRVADSCSDIADAMLRLCLRSMGMPGNALASVLDDLPPLPGVTPASLLQATSYNRQQGIVAEAHTDRGLLTVVWESSPGLEVLSSAGTWQPVALAQNQVAVFAGEALEHATAGAIHAALHRVSQSEARSVPRVSLSYKQRPAPYSVIDLRNMPNFVPNKRYIHPLVVSHATALFEASHRSINQPPPAAAAAADGRAGAHNAQALKQEAAEQQQQQQDQQQEAARYNLRRRSLPEEERPPLPPSQRARISPANQPLHPALATPSEDYSQPEQVSGVINITFCDSWGSGCVIKVKQSTPMQRVLEAYCRKICADWRQMRFILDGDPLCPEMPTKMSVAQCGLRHGDIVDALVEQYGD